MIANANRTSRISQVEPTMELIGVASVEGFPVWIPKVTYEAMKRSGCKITVEFESDHEWLTVSEAAKLHLEDRDDMSMATSKARVSRAAKDGRFKSVGKRTNRRIDPVSFNAWRLEQRERELDKAI